MATTGNVVPLIRVLMSFIFIEFASKSTSMKATYHRGGCCRQEGKCTDPPPPLPSFLIIFEIICLDITSNLTSLCEFPYYFV
ncbi:hypothetical protein AMTRI_Chr13g87510 [Amborella trichopoda]